MKSFGHAALIVSLTCLGAREAAAVATRPQITVLIFNYAHISRANLDKAFMLASSVFAKAGIGSTWVDCPLPNEDRREQTCEQTQGPEVLFLRIVPGAMASRLSMPESVFGMAAVPGNGKPGVYAWVFYDRLQKLAGEHSIAIPLVLAHVGAHEVGHLLLGSNAHSAGGIMTSDWYGKNLRKAAQGELLFSSEQAHRMQIAVAARSTRERGADPDPTKPFPPGARSRALLRPVRWR